MADLREEIYKLQELVQELRAERDPWQGLRESTRRLRAAAERARVAREKLEARRGLVLIPGGRDDAR